MKKINSVFLKEPNDISIKEINLPEKKDREALIKIESMGICGSDIGAFRGANPLVSYPRIIGHEIIGTVIEGGEGLPKNITIGDRVILDPYVYCGTCYPCSIGRTNCCENLKVIGVHINGGMQEYFTHPAKLLHKIPDNIPVEHAPLAEPLTIALHALHRTKLKQGEHVVIIGAGAIGLLMALSAIHYQAIPILIDIVPERLSYANKIGIQYTINSSKENAQEQIKQITKNRLSEVVIEASGANSAIKNTLEFVSFAGRIALTGWPKIETSLPTNIITFKEVDIMGSRTSANEFPEALELIAKRIIKPEQIISKIIEIEDVPAAVKELSSYPDRYLKIHAVIK